MTDTGNNAAVRMHRRAIRLWLYCVAALVVVMVGWVFFRSTTIEQALGTPRQRTAGARYLAQFIESMKASGFVAASLRASGQLEAEVAPAAS